MEFVLGVLVAVVAGGIAFAIVVLATGADPGLVPHHRDRAPETLPTDRPLTEPDVSDTRFDTGLRGYRTTQVDATLARISYDIGFKDELIRVLASEVTALRDGRTEDADTFRSIRRRAIHGRVSDDSSAETTEPSADTSAKKDAVDGDSPAADAEEASELEADDADDHDKAPKPNTESEPAGSDSGEAKNE